METIDLLPDAYRQRTARRRANRELLLMAIPVVVALIGTDLLLRNRVRGVRHMAQQAHENARHGETIAAESKELQQRAAGLEAALTAASRPLAARRMTVLLDGLLKDRPPGVRFQELQCQLDPWSESSLPAIQLRAGCATAAEFTGYLTALRGNPDLPPMRCERSDIRAGSGEFGFHLETDTHGAATPAGAPR